MLELVLLGSPLVRVGGAPVTVPTRKALALVSLLAIEGPAQRGRVADVLWPSIEPEKARGNLRRELNRLRHTPLADLMESEGQAISLRKPFGCDVRTFLDHVENNEHARALELYRGPLLDGLELYDADGFDDWLARRRAALEERYRGALALEAKAREARGDLRAALQAYLDLLRLDETQETYHREAMRLHYLVGEREAALERFARMKRVLRRDLALEPLPETLELYRTIRAAQPLASEAAPVRAPAVTHAPLVGREAELAALEASRAPLVVLLGEAGIGKTRLAQELGRRLGSFLVARGSEVATLTPLYPFATALDDALDDPEARRRLADLGTVYRREASRLVPAIDPNAEADDLPREARARFLEGLARALAAAVGPGGVLVLDDVHWLDAASAELGLYLARRASSLGIRLVATARSHELDGSGGLALVEAAEREGLAERLRLGPLRDADVEVLIRALKHDAAESFAKRLHELTGGNPLYVIETLRSMLSKGTLPSAGDRKTYTLSEPPSELPVPSGVRGTVLGQIARLGPRVRRLLDAASLGGAHFSLDEIRGATGLGSFEAVDALEHAVLAGVLARVGEGSMFCHELVRRALSDSLGAERKRLLHEKLAESLARKPGAAARVADHLVLAGKASEAVAFRMRAAEDSLKVLAHPVALRQYERALESDELSEQTRFEIRVRRAAIFRVLDDRASWQTEVEALAALAGAAASTSLVVRAALCRAELDNAAGRFEQALGQADFAEGAARGDDLLEARALLASGEALLNLGRSGESRERLEKALSKVGDGDLELTSHTHRALYRAAIEQNQLAQAELHNERARAADEARGDRHGMVVARLNTGTIRRRSGDLEGSRGALEAALQGARDAGFASLERAILLALASTHNLLGDYDRAAELAEQGLALASDPEDPLMEARLLNALAVFEYSRGRLGSSLRHSERAVERALEIRAGWWSAFFRFGLAHTLLELGAHARAVPVIEAARCTIEELGIAGQHVVLESHLAHAELLAVGAEPARARIERALATGAARSLDAEYTLALYGLAELRSNRPEAALRTIEAHEFRPLHRSRAEAVRLRAKQELGMPLDEDLASAEALLRDTRIAPLESLELRQSVIGVLERDGETARAEEHRRAAQALAARLSEELADFPGVRAAFAAKLDPEL